MLKKLSLSFLMIPLMLLSCSSSCEHEYVTVKTVDPTTEKEGCVEYTCPLCGDKDILVLPILNETNYKVENLTANCIHGNGKRYMNEKYGTYEVTDDVREPHTTNNGICDNCHHQIGEFHFVNLTSTICWGYPRLIKLSEKWNNVWILSGDSGGAKCRMSFDEGKTWGEPISIHSSTTHGVGNTIIYELPNHNLLCMYREIGNATNEDIELKYSRKLSCSISYDGGYTWEFLESFFDNLQVVENYNKKKSDAIFAMLQESRIGAYEPFMGLINGVPTVVYADDFTPMLLEACGSSPQANYRAQYLISQTFDMKSNSFSKERKMIIDGTKLKAPTGSGLLPRVSRDGMPEFGMLKDGTYVIVYEGTYRDSSYPSLTGDESLVEFHPFEILISYSRDGENWSDPIEVYTPKNQGSKASAPYICINDKDQLIISFQTDEDAVTSGYVGDKYSIMKVIVSKPGISVENINKDSFYAVCNNNDTPVGQAGLWNGMMLLGNDLYTVTGGYPIRHSEVPLYVES